MALAFRAYGFWLTQYRRVWRGSVTSSVLSPVLYLGALGAGLGSLVNEAPDAPGGGSYLHFVAPGLLAAATMQIGAQESSYPVMGAIRWSRTYFAQLATPLGPRAVLAGHQLYVATRLAFAAGTYLVVIAAFGGARS